MNTNDGTLRELRDGEHLPSVEELRDMDEIPPEVEVPADYWPMTPEQRLASAFSFRAGKDRKAANPRPKSERQRRAERAEHRKAMKARRSQP